MMVSKKQAQILASFFADELEILDWGVRYWSFRCSKEHSHDRQWNSPPLSREDYSFCRVCGSRGEWVASDEAELDLAVVITKALNIYEDSQR